MRQSGIGSRYGMRVAALVASLGLVLSLAQPARAGAGYSWDGRTAVIAWREAPGELGDARFAVALTVYGDGLVSVVRGPARRDAGEYTLRLSRPELDALVQQLVAAGVPSFDGAVVARGRRAAAAQRAAEARAGRPVTLRVTSDVGNTTIEVHLDQGQRTVKWNGVREDAREYPEIAALQGLAAADAALRALASHPRLRRVR